MTRQEKKVFYKKTKDFSPRLIVATAYYVAIDAWSGAGCPEPTVEERDFEREILNVVEFDEWFHGGVSGRQIGEAILSSGELGVDIQGWGDAEWRRQFVYIAAKSRKAAVYADRIGGSVYRVQPEEPIGLDIIDLRALKLALGAPKLKAMERKKGREVTLRFISGAIDLGFVSKTVKVLEVLHG